MRLSRPPEHVSTVPEPPALRPSQEVRRRLRNKLRELAANLMSVSRGAGKPFALCSEVVSVGRELETYREVVGGYPSPEELSTMLHLGNAPQRPIPISGDDLEWALSLTAAVRGSLRIAAARLLDFSTEELAGQTELYYGINRLEALRTARTIVRPSR